LRGGKSYGSIEQRGFNRDLYRVSHLSDSRPLSDNEADDRLKAARAALGEAPGATQQADTALAAARNALALISLGLIKAGLKRET
jgi:hypothetical protein